MNLNFENVCAKLGAKKVGSEWLALCPAHDDRNPSLAITRGNKREVVFVCRAGCAQESVLRAVNVRVNGAGCEIQKTEPNGWGYSLPKLERAEAELNKAETFLSSRGITLDTARELRFGFENGRLVMPTFVEGELAAVKLRAIAPHRHEDKWRKSNRDRGVYHLFNRDAAITFDDLWVVESELDAAMLTSLGFAAVSVDSANHTLSPADIELLKCAGRVLLALDADEPGQKCATRIAAAIPDSKLIRMPDGIKDLGELYVNDPKNFVARLEPLRQAALDRPPLWRERFHTVDELPDGDIGFLIENVLPEGVSFVGALSGVGKSWVCLSMARALTTGKKFLGNWNVPEPVEVLYLCPEMSAKTFKKRCKRFGISDRFYCQTISDGTPLDLSDPILASAISDLKPVVFLDTAIRFANVEDENSASQNAHGLAKAIFALIHLGAKAVVCLHHRAKDTARAEEMTLENVLRGTGDLGAMCDAVWGLQSDRGTGDLQYVKESKKLVRLSVRCVKARDFRPPDDFRIQLEPFIDQIGDMAVLADDSNGIRETEIEALDRAIAADPKIEKTKLEDMTGVGRNRQEALAAERGWQYDKKTKWTRSGE